MTTSGQQNVVKIIHRISKEGKNNKCSMKVCILKSFQKLYKTINQSISCNVPDFFLLEEHSKANWVLKRHSKGTWALGHSKSTWALGQSRNLVSRALKWHLSTWALEWHLGTRAFEWHLGTRDTRGTLFSRLIWFQLCLYQN